MSADELIDWVDENDHVIGQVTRKQMRAQNLLHRCIAVMCVSSQGLIYTHRRTVQKDLFPGMYDMFVGGVVQAGESYEHAATREIGEELGIVGPIPELLFHHLYEGPQSRSHTAVFRVRWDGPIVHQPSEVAWGGYCSLETLRSEPTGWTFVPDGHEIFLRYLKTQKHY